MNKKGLEMAIGTIVIIVLALVLLASSLYILTRAKGEFAQTIKSYFTKTNVDLIKSQCNRLAESEASYEYCCVDREVKLEREKKFMNCLEAGEEIWGEDIVKLNCEGICE